MLTEVIVSVNEGEVRGIKQKSSFSGVEFCSFYAIPYAQPPVDELRFKDPVRVNPWNGIYDATTEKEGCAQFSYTHYRYMGSEDCLYLNIHTPNLPTKDEPLKPVVVLIHPGSLMNGSPDSSHHGSPNFVMHNDVVYVGIAYRLHILGFLNLDVEECSGNQGIKDIIMALEWIQENVRFFNGDPQNITLLGYSSGAVVIHILMLSPLLKIRGLFHKAVITGSYLFNTAVSGELQNKIKAFSFARALGFEGNDQQELLKFLKQIPIEKLIQHVKKFKMPSEDIAPVYPIVPFLPTMDRGDNAILPIHPRKLIPKIMKIPLIFGICERETILGFTENLKEITDKTYRKSFRQNRFAWMHQLDDNEFKIVNELIDSFYLNNSTQEIPSSIKADILTDGAFSEVYDTLIDPVSEQLPSSVYVYKFLFEGDVVSMKTTVRWKFDGPMNGTFHLDDLSYWACLSKPKTKETIQKVYTFTELICTFARTAVPQCKELKEQWRPSTVEKPCYLSIDNTLKVIDGKLNGERMKFWDDLKSKFKKY